MNIHKNITSQYLASLEMLKQVIERCPASIWNSPEDKMKFWQIAFHALFFTHFYLQDTAQTFTTWSKHRPEHESFNQDRLAPLTPYEREELLEYLVICQEQVKQKVSNLNMETDSGFHWLPFNKLELQIYNIRHLQQHTGELMERLGTRAEVEIDWVAMGS
jgi:hypothetical protein